MNMNSYGWVVLLIVCIAFTSWIGGEAGYTIGGVPADAGALDFIGNLALGKIDGMPIWITAIFDCIPFLVGWIIYRQIRGQD